jgi:hypothetical protein
MKNIKYLLLAAMFGAAVFSSCKKDDDKTPATKPVITLEAGEAEGSYKVAVKSDSDLTSVVVKTKAGDEEKTAADVKTFTNAKEYTFEGVIEFPAKVYAAVVTVTATNKKDLSNTQELTVSIPEPPVDPDAPVLYNWAKEFVTVSRAAWNANHAAGKIYQHTEDGGLIEDDVHYIPDEWSDPESEGVWTKFHVAGKTYNTADMLEIATRAYLMLQGYDAATKVENGGYGKFDKLSPAATLTTEIPEVHGYKWGGMPYNESGVTEVGGEVKANGGPIRFGDPLKGTVAGTPNKCRQDIMVSYAQRHLIWPFTHDMVMSNMCGYNSDSQRSQVNNEFFGNVCVKRFYMMMLGFFEYMLDNNLMDVSSIPADQLFDCTLFGNAKWD